MNMSSSVKKMTKFDFIQAFERLLVKYADAYLDYMNLARDFDTCTPNIVRKYVRLKNGMAKFELILNRHLPPDIEVD